VTQVSRLAFLIAAVMIGLDQLTKVMIRNKLELYNYIQIIPDYFRFFHTVNKGAAWSILWGNVGLLTAISLVVSIGVAVYIVRDRTLSKFQAAGWGFILGGAVGNLIDRAYFQQVTDFFDFYMTIGGAERHFPTFNVADVSLNIGVACLLITYGILDSTPKQDEPAKIEEIEPLAEKTETPQ